MADADLTLVVVDVSAPLEADDFGLMEQARAQGRSLVAGNKCDLPRRAEQPTPVVEVSALTGQGIDELRREIIEQRAGRLRAGDRIRDEPAA